MPAASRCVVMPEIVTGTSLRKRFIFSSLCAIAFLGKQNRPVWSIAGHTTDIFALVNRNGLGCFGAQKARIYGLFGHFRYLFRLGLSSHDVFRLDRTLYSRHPFGLDSAELLLVFRYLVGEILREPLRVLRRKRVGGTFLTGQHAQNEEFLRKSACDVLAKSFRYFREVHNISV